VGVMSYPSNFFNNGAAQHGGAEHTEDKLKGAILASDRKDATTVRRVLNWLGRWLVQTESRADDQMEQAILACQRRDAAIVKHILLD